MIVYRELTDEFTDHCTDSPMMPMRTSLAFVRYFGEADQLKFPGGNSDWGRTCQTKR